MTDSTMMNLLNQYVFHVHSIYGDHLKRVILYGSYARGDFHEDSDVDIMFLLDLSDLDIKKYRHDISSLTYDYNLNYDVDIKPISKNEDHFLKWKDVYPFYLNVDKGGVVLYGAA